MLLKKKDDTLVTYVQAAKGEASTVKKHLPFVWAHLRSHDIDVDYMERMLREEDSIAATKSKSEETKRNGVV